MNSRIIPRAFALQQANERGAESPIENGINNRIDCRGHVAQPEERVYHVSRHRTRGTRGEEDVKEKEWRPAQHEREEHQAQDLACLLFRRHRVCGQGSLFRSSRQESERTSILKGKDVEFLTREIFAVFLPLSRENSVPEVQGVGRDVQLQFQGPEGEVPCFARDVLRRLGRLIHFRLEP